MERRQRRRTSSHSTGGRAEQSTCQTQASDHSITCLWCTFGGRGRSHECFRCLALYTYLCCSRHRKRAIARLTVSGRCSDQTAGDAHKWGCAARQVDTGFLDPPVTSPTNPDDMRLTMGAQTSACALLAGDSETAQETPHKRHRAQKTKVHDGQWLPAREAADYCGLGFSTMAKMRLTGEGPEFSKVGAKVLYYRPNLDRYLHGRSRVNTSQMGG